MSSTAEQSDIEYIKNDLLPEMVHDRCFCPANSREFVELTSTSVEAAERYPHHLEHSLYRATVRVDISGEPRTFHVRVKLLPADLSDLQNQPKLALAYDGFLNEEIVFNKALPLFGQRFFPKCYAASMGKYGRPAIVVEDPEGNGFVRVVDRELNEEEGNAVARMLGQFHTKGFELRETDCKALREIRAKIQEIVFAEAGEEELRKKIDAYASKLKSRTGHQRLGDPYAVCRGSLQLAEEDDTATTLCQGLVLPRNLWFGPELEVRILDWQHVRFGPASLDLCTLVAGAGSPDVLLGVYESSVQLKSLHRRQRIVEGRAHSYSVIAGAVADPGEE